MTMNAGAAGILLAGLLAMPLVAAEPTKTPPSSVPEGKWGGVGLLVEFGASGARVELDAAHGSMEGPLALDAEGRFEANGTLVRERPGPTRIGDENAEGEPARYRGTIADDTLTLDLTLTKSGKAIGPLQAKRGAPARLRKMY
jgi:hypothetical protein